MSLTHINFDWPFYFSMVALCTMWNLGFFAITRRGNIGDFVLKFLEKKKLVRKKYSKEAEQDHRRLLSEYLVLMISDEKESSFGYLEKQYPTSATINAYRELGETEEIRKSRQEKLEKWVEEYFKRNKVKSRMCSHDVLLSLTYGDYLYLYFETAQKILPDWITDPLGTCVTCMASVHSLIIYTAVVLLENANFHHWFPVMQHFKWNPLEWAIVAIPTAFLGEFFWSLKRLIQSKIT